MLIHSHSEEWSWAGWLGQLQIYSSEILGALPLLLQMTSRPSYRVIDVMLSHAAKADAS